ncbi:MAG: UDP-3-O-(3-hydroxymyristoyl)glucosamine N-acyltransferase [Pseudomonadales bacterium]|nr:UDP-3-O-(3-hydroxymyristoyl)glucosamine N-acyltransferase [Pseudomonadales bacterium]
MAKLTEFSLASLAELLDVELSGDPSVSVSSMATLGRARTGQLSFFSNPRYLADLQKTRASAVILHPDYREKYPGNCLLSASPYLSYAKASRLFEPRPIHTPAIDPRASIHPSARVDATATIHANVVIGANTFIGKAVTVGANSSIGADCRVGEGSVLHPNVVLYQGVNMGKRCCIHSGAVIGSDGFGFAQDDGKHIKIAQLGTVQIGDDVEIGAGSTVDRGALDDTIIEAGVKIDNLVQIAHNVRIGANTLICGCTGIAGSAVIGKNCTIAGGVGISNHVTVADGVTITAMSLVNRSITMQGMYSSGTFLTDTLTWRRNAVRFGQLDNISRRLRKIEKSSDKKDHGAAE